LALKGDSLVIEVQHLTKRYGPVTAVDDISFRGRARARSSASSAQRRRQDDDDADPDRLHAGHRGQAIVAGFDVFDQPIEAKRRTGYLPETPPLYPT
jgi:ABC-2 type transport system ATP-binding protein